MWKGLSVGAESRVMSSPLGGVRADGSVMICVVLHLRLRTPRGKGSGTSRAARVQGRRAGREARIEPSVWKYPDERAVGGVG